MIPIYSTPTYKLEASTKHINDKLLTLELYQTFPQAQRPRAQRVLQLNLPPDKVRALGLFLVGQSTK